MFDDADYVANKKALRQILLPYVRNGDFKGYLTKLLDESIIIPPATARDKKFREHMESYFLVLTGSRGIQFERCDRYSNDSGYDGFRIVATRRFWRQSSLAITGTAVYLTPEEEKKLLKPGINDFSVTYSSFKKKYQLMLGPVAFVNHSCRANSNFIFKAWSRTHMEVTLNVLTPTLVDEEITVFYGDHYFGHLNECCECSVCSGNSHSNVSELSFMNYKTIDPERRKYYLRTQKSLKRKQKPAVKREPVAESTRISLGSSQLSTF